MSDKIMATLKKWHFYFSASLERTLSGTESVTEYRSLPDSNAYFPRRGWVWF